MIRPTIPMTVTWIHHMFKYDLHTVTRCWHLLVAILMTVTRIRVALDLDLTTVTSFSMIQLTVSMTVTRISQELKDNVHTVTSCWSVRPEILLTVTEIRVGTNTNFAQLQGFCASNLQFWRQPQGIAQSDPRIECRHTAQIVVNNRSSWCPGSAT